MIYRQKCNETDGYVAVFRSRSDGDWDFVAMVCDSETQFPMLSQADVHQSSFLIDSIACAIEAEGDTALIARFPDPNVPSVFVCEIE